MHGLVNACPSFGGKLELLYDIIMGIFIYRIYMEKLYPYYRFNRKTPIIERINPAICIPERLSPKRNIPATIIIAVYMTVCIIPICMSFPPETKR